MDTSLNGHPELVSGSIRPLAVRQWRKAKAHRKVVPIGVLALDQVDLPLPMPALELLLASDGGRHVAKYFVSDQRVDAVALCEALDLAVSMLPQPSNEVRGYADVECAVARAGEDIDAWVAFEGHLPERDKGWTLKQVQGDGFGERSQ